MIDTNFASFVFWLYCATIKESERPSSSLDRASEPINATLMIVGTSFASTFWTPADWFPDENP